MAEVRTRRLNTLFDKVLKGKPTAATNKPKLFLEALCEQTPVAVGISRLVGSPEGLETLRLALESDTSLSFLNGELTTFLEYIKTPVLRTVCAGSVLRQVLAKVMEAPFTWKSFVSAARDKALDQRALSAFAWLLFQLMSLPREEAMKYLPVAKDPGIHKALMSSSDDIQCLGQRITRIANNLTYEPKKEERQGPGDRHENDFAEIHKIAIYPTEYELKLATSDVYLPKAADVAERAQDPDGLANHIDSQFRLLREDMLCDLREELKVLKEREEREERKGSKKPKKRQRKLLEIQNLKVCGVHCNERSFWALQLACKDDLPQLQDLNPNKRKKFLKDNPKFLKHGFFVCLFVDNSFVTLGTLVREEDLLLKSPSVLCVQIPGTNIAAILMQLKDAGSSIHLLQIDTAIFTYEPVLKQLQRMRELSLAPEIISWKAGTWIPPPDYYLSSSLEELLDTLSYEYSFNLQSCLELPNQTKLDKAQADCFRAALQQRVVVIQGPPGTGKSFIGSLVGKAIHQFSKETILVVCYTHHALDDFVEHLLSLGIPDGDIVRLGSTVKASARTSSLGLREYKQNIKFTREQGTIFFQRKQELQVRAIKLKNDFAQFFNSNPSNREILDFLEFCEDDLPFHDAFQVPENGDGMTWVGERGKVIDEYYLLDRWIRGMDAGIFKSQVPHYYQAVWRLPHAKRWQKYQQWCQELTKDKLVQLSEAAKLYNLSVEERDAVEMEKDLAVMRNKRIIACTTTAAAKYSNVIQCISPGVLLVEEAGEILESHVLTALGPETKHLILIGDHKQLRPKVNYELSVEKKMGYDLNRSLFERLILKKFPYQTLFAQHRMRPEISALVRIMTYPELKDAKETQGRPNLRGFTDNIIFVNHDEPESELGGLHALGDSKATSSKQNQFEAKMTLKCVRYLGQQGYRTDDIVVLTPYLGQLRLLHDELKVDNDPVLNDLDSHDLVRAGLMPEATAKLNKPRLRISTIDNFQGEEANIVVASLCRSNSNNDIGFMDAPERLNVLISRARNALILIGNAENFMYSRKGGGDLWKKFLGLLKDGKHIYHGFPVRCERHPDREAILEKPADFDAKCPDGGCSEPCDKLLNCGIHNCPDRCHQLVDHSKIKCKAFVSIPCPKGHVNKQKCHARDPDVCFKCEIEAKKAREEAERKAKAEETQRKHLIEMAEIDRQMQALKAEAADNVAAKQQAIALEQKKKDFQDAINAKKNVASKTTPNQTPNASQPQTKRDPKDLSPAEADWERQKKFEGASNDAIDALMCLTGLEAVKEKALNIKMKIDTLALQSVDLSKERFSTTMLGNPGTGKTTVARIYGQFLASVKAIQGSNFVEVSGSSLANDGVNGAKKKIEDLVNAGGGVFFLDEAYQLASGNSSGGKAVLDYLLAEIEERRGTIVFILAGYKKEMEAFFEHNPGFLSRVPHTLNFEDYSDEELLKMLAAKLQKDYKGRAKLEGGVDGLYARILIRRLGRRRGSRAYGNARDLENTWSLVTERLAKRLRQERHKGLSPDPLFFTKTDLIGPKPSQQYLSQNSKAWQELQELIGLESVKQAVGFFLNRIATNYERELQEKPLMEVSLNKLFLGSPGTGKTTVAKLYGEILAEIGLLSKGEMVIKTPADFIGAHLGESEKNTKAILQASVGKVLVIDEAYGLFPPATEIGRSSHNDSFKTAVIDTIVAEVQSVPGEDRCVLLLGYTDQMKEVLRTTNPGMSRRFPLDSAFHFKDFDDVELRQILELKLKKQGLEATKEAKDVAIGLLARARDRTNFGNAGEVENLLSRAKDNWQKRQALKPTAIPSSQVIFGPEDFDEKYDRVKTSECTVKELFADIVGLDELIEKLEGYQKLVVNLKAREMDPREFIPFTFVFKGPPGTGKTTVARRIAEFYYNIGILPTKEYTDCSAADLVAGYLGQTALKTREKLRSALGKVLFIDEAYRLQDGVLGKEAINEIVDCLTKTDFLGKLVVILAGYTDDINSLLRVNPGLASRFPHEVFFESMQPERCIELLDRLLSKSDLEVTTDVRTSQSEGYRQMLQLFAKLRELPSWGNGRDVETLAKKIVSAAFENAPQSAAKVKVAVSDIQRAMEKMLAEQTARSKPKPSPRRGTKEAFKQATEHSDMPNVSTSSSTKQEAGQKEPVIKSPSTEKTPNFAGMDGREQQQHMFHMAELDREIKAAMAESKPKSSTGNPSSKSFMQAAQPLHSTNVLKPSAASSIVQRASPPIIKPSTSGQAQNSAETVGREQQQQHMLQMIDRNRKMMWEPKVKPTTVNPSNKTFMQVTQPLHNTDVLNRTATPSIALKACPPVIKPSTIAQAQNSAPTDGRDPGVSDEVWYQLQLDIAIQKKKEEEAQAELQRQEEEFAKTQRELETTQTQIRSQLQSRDTGLASMFTGLFRSRAAKAEEESRQLELERARIRAIELKRAKDAKESQLYALREMQSRQRRQEQQAQKRLRDLGVCVAGFRWIKQAGGYRCAGGSHFVSDGQLGL